MLGQPQSKASTGCSFFLFIQWAYLVNTVKCSYVQKLLRTNEKSVNIVCVPVCLGKEVISWSVYTALLKNSAGKQSITMVTVKGEGEGCVSGVLAARWTLAGGLAREPAIRSEVLCHWLCSASLRFPSLPVSRMALLSPSCEWKAARRTNTEYKWDSWEETHFLLLSLAGSFVYRRQNSAGYYIILFVGV